jgi:plasmid stabilization system protein ParE
MATVRRSPQAETDLETILEDLQQKNPSVAERYANEFYDKGKALAQFPEIGRIRPEIAPHASKATRCRFFVSCMVSGICGASCGRKPTSKGHQPPIPDAGHFDL